MQLLLHRPSNYVPHRVKVEMQIERHRVIESQAFVVNRVAADQAKTERDDFFFDTPNKKARALRHCFCDRDKEFFAQVLEFHGRSLVDLEIEGKNVVNNRRDIVHELHVDLRGTFRFTELPAQTLATDIAELLEIFVEIRE